MHTALLTTKLTVPPPRAGLIVRPRLLARLDEGMAFSVEPGIYIPGACGARLEDIVVCTADGHEPLNRGSHDLVVLGS